MNSEDIFEGEINKQVAIAIEEADVILFVVDVMNGITDLDEHVAHILRRANKPVVLVANKADTFSSQYDSAEFYSFGLGDPYCVSAINGSGTGDLLDWVVSKFTKEEKEPVVEDIPRFAVVGRPNAGKSSIVTAFIGEERKGTMGGFACALGVAFPSLVIITIIAAFIGGFADMAAVKNAFAGIRVCVCVLIYNAVLKLWKKAIIDAKTFVIFACVFLASVFTDISPILFVIAAAVAGILIKVLGVKKA